MKKLLEAGAHFGHETKRWNPKMKKYIYAKRNGIHIIDLQQTVPLAEKAEDFVREIVKKGDQVLFVGTKKQAREAVEHWANKCGMPFVSKRWLGGTLTNFETIRKSVKKLIELEDLEKEGFPGLKKKEISKKKKIMEKLNKDIAGLKEMKRLPGAMFIVDTTMEDIALKEAKKLNIPIIAIVDTNSDPDLVDMPVPGNDDAIRAVALFCEMVARGVLDAQNEIGEGSVEFAENDSEGNAENFDEVVNNSDEPEDKDLENTEE